MRRTIIGCLTVLGLSLVTVAPAAAVTPSATPTGGKVSADGTSATINVDLLCPKGDRYTANLTIILAELGRDDAAARGTAEGKCTGRTQHIKIRVTAFDNPPLPRNCSAEYGLGVTGTTFAYAIDRGGADGGGPAFCLV
jgi:hypothetical protein